jgi:hypothetical protein
MEGEPKEGSKVRKIMREQEMKSREKVTNVA